MTATATSKSPSEALLLGHPQARRSQLLQAACARAGLKLELLDWNEFLASPARLAQHLRERRPRWLKIDSPGEDAHCTRQLQRLGYEADGTTHAPPPGFQPGEIAGQALWHAGLRVALARITAILAEVPAPPHLLNGIAGICAMMDKWQCQQRLAPVATVPHALGLVQSLDQIEAQWPVESWPRIFIKPRYGSSAAGVIALQRRRDGGLAAHSAARRDSEERVFNHLRISRYQRRDDIAALVSAVAREGAYAEAWVRKPRAPAPHRGSYDLRVVAHAGRARQRVARISTSPMTNLHLGNARALPDWLDAATQQQVETQVAAAARAFPDCHSIGFDLIATPRGITVLEANAFGDLLPGLHCEGSDTYDDQARLMRSDDA
jgi:hypothetical protein